MSSTRLRVLLVVASVLVSAASALANSPDAAAEQRPQGRASAVLDVLTRIETTLVFSEYSPVTRVNAAQGSYVFDCSGMADWVLRRAAPAAWQSVRRRSPTGRPVARDFYRAIAAVRPDRPSYAWARVARVDEARAGDVVAWLKPAHYRSSVTGHVAFLVSSPEPSTVIEGAYLVRIADASRYQHQADSRSESGRTGFGTGTILIVPDAETGAPVAYGWFGEHSSWISETPIAIGRPRH